MGNGLSKKVTGWVARGTILATLVAATVTYTSMQKTLVIDQDGQLSEVQFFGHTVDEALLAGNVTLADSDVVSPATNDRVTSGDIITVRSATTATVASRSDDLGRERLAEFALKDIVVTVDGQSVDTVTSAPTVREVLLEMGVVLEEGDTVSLDLNEATTAHQNISIGRATSDSLTVTEALKFEVEERKDANLAKGTRKVVQQGRVGEAVTIYQVNLVGGVESGRSVLARTVSAEPRNEIVAIGTKVAAKASSNAGAVYAGSGDVWSKLAKCESGGRPGVVSASGRYHGLYQFSVQTWRSVGGSGLPSQASPAEQTKRAKILQARSGWGQWPSCSRQIGVR